MLVFILTLILITSFANHLKAFKILYIQDILSIKRRFIS
jgi:hypothetical protein